MKKNVCVITGGGSGMGLAAAKCMPKDKIIVGFSGGKDSLLLVYLLGQLMKDEKIKLMGGLDQEFLIPMIQELPMDLTQIVMTQIDPRDFSEILARDFEDILSSVVMFSTKGA